MRKLDFFAVLLTVLFFAGCETNSYTLEEEEDGTSDNEQSIDEADINNYGDHEESTDCTWSTSEVEEILFNGSSITENCDGVSASGSTLTISAAGTYQLSGTLTNGRVVVEAGETDLVRLLLNGVDITTENSAPITIRSAEKVIVVLNDNTQNSLTDGSSYNYDDYEEEEPNATLFSKTDLTVYGEGELIINGNFNDGINCKDGLIIESNKLTITAVDEGIRGKDYLIIKKGNFTIDAGGDGIKSDNKNDETRGYIKILTGSFNISAKGDAISAATDVLIEDGTFDLATTGTVTSSNGVSSKGIKSGVNTIINYGTFAIKTTDDALHSDQTLTINDGDFTISANDDGVRAEYDLIINGGSFNITKSYEGLESGAGNMYVNGGIIELVSSDDGVNLAGGGNGMGSGWHKSATTTSYTMYLNPDKLAIYAQGDGIDANGSVKLSGGTVIIHGPTGNGNGILDYDQSFIQTGGTLIGTGSSGMLQTPGSSSTQNCLVLAFRSTQTEGKICHIETSSGDALCSIKPAKKFQAFIYCSPNLKLGTDYDFYTGGSVTGASFNGYYSDETYTAGTKQTSFSLSKAITGIQLN